MNRERKTQQYRNIEFFCNLLLEFFQIDVKSQEITKI